MKKTHSLNHYTYVINDLVNGKSYIGVRTCECIPVDDIEYMGSSVYLNEVIAQKGLNNFEKVILTEWPTRELAAEHEIQLHNEFNVATNEQFYNKANATSTGFTTLGNKEAIAKMLESRAKNGVWQEAMDKNNKNPENIKKRARGIRNKISKDPTYVKRRIDSRKETIQTAEWKETTGMQVRENMRKTFNDPQWKATTGVEKSKKIAELKRIRDKQNKKECIHCKRMLDPANYAHWHGVNCKLNNEKAKA